MTISDRHIKEAEAILINGNTFDAQERVPFIKNLETRDLLAVPGSGKTTALQAKLYCLAKQMPFEDRSGILVLSHTNKAVEEIEKKLKNHCPQLFEYPNFVGTVQGFVNHFLANPGLHQKYGAYLSVVDDQIANKNIEIEIAKKQDASRFHSFLFFQSYPANAVIDKNKLISEFGLSGQETSEFIKILQSNKAISKGSLNYEKVKNNEKRLSLNLSEKFKQILDSIHKSAYKKANEEKFKIGCQYSIDFKELRFIRYDQKLGFSSESGGCLLGVYEFLFKKGIVRYRDCYSIAFQYVVEYCKIIDILRSRFRHIFIDEAQDLEKYQLDIIESIFNTNESTCVIQRIGDINQSIYNSGRAIKVDCDWKPRNPLHLTTSLRLTKEVADVVDYFTLKKESECENTTTHQFIVEGKNNVGQTIKPHLIIFDNNTKGQLKPKFEELISQFNLFDGSKGENTERDYKIIGWSGTWKEEEDNKGKLRLKDIFPDEYKPAIESNKNRVKLCDYLVHNPKIRTLKKYQDDIIDALCTLLRSVGCIAKVKRKGQEIERYYTSQILWKYIVDESRKTDGKLSEQDLLDFKSKLYIWSFSIAINNNIENTYNEIKSFVNDKFSKWFEFGTGNTVTDFFGEHYKSNIIECSDTSEQTEQNIPIEICSVHSVKGQTHCATMYVETSYYTYETNKLSIQSKPATKKRAAEYFNNPLLKQNHNFPNEVRLQAKQAMKMMYVGFSRPTHLLCFAVLRQNLTEEQLSYFNSKVSGWEVVDLMYDCSTPLI